MKDGIETRTNGNLIVKTKRGYKVFIKKNTKSYSASKNGPWDYLFNARKDAGGGFK